MTSTGIRLSPDMQSRLATGHDNRYEPTPNWDTPTLAGAGALRSTANDMLSFLAAQLDHTKSSLSPAIAATRAHWTPAGAGMEIGLGWWKRSGKNREIIAHDGGTDGYSSFVGFDPVARTGVVVLANVRTLAGVDDLGFHLLDSESPLLPADSPRIRPPSVHTEIKLDTAILDGYAGQYQLAPGAIFTVTRDGDHLYAQLTGQRQLEVFAEGDGKFFYKVVDAQITFETAGQGPASALILHQGGQDLRARQIYTVKVPVCYVRCNCKISAATLASSRNPDRWGGMHRLEHLNCYLLQSEWFKKEGGLLSSRNASSVTLLMRPSLRKPDWEKLPRTRIMKARR